MTVDVHVWKEAGVDSGFIDAAMDTLNTQLDPELNFDIDAYNEAKDHNAFNRNNSNWNDIFDNFDQYVVHHHGCPDDNDYHLLITDAVDGLGAGKCLGTVNESDTRNPFNDTSCSGCNAAIGGVNAAVKAWVSGDQYCYGGDGNKAFRGTVQHEVLHGVVDHDAQNMVSDVCGESNNEHSLGSIYSKEDYPCTPLRLWYTDNVCTENDSPCETCAGHDDWRAEDIALTNLSYCEKDRAEEYASNHNL